MLNNILYIGFFFGILGTFIGGLIGILVKFKTNKTLSCILEFAAGLMLAVVSFDLLPESFEFGGNYITILFFIIGVMVAILLENIINKYTKINERKNNYSSNRDVQNKLHKHSFINDSNLIKTGILVGIGLALHNFPEGLAIGSGFSASTSLGLSLALVIAFHDIPEGISMAVPMKAGGMGIFKTLLITFLSGVPTAIGAYVGMVIGSISKIAVAACLAFAGGTMAYIISRRFSSRIKKIIFRKNVITI